MSLIKCRKVANVLLVRTASGDRTMPLWKISDVITESHILHIQAGPNIYLFDLSDSVSVMAANKLLMALNIDYRLQPSY